MEDQGKLLDRIRKLLALANHPATPEHEAAAAAARVQAILAEHNIEMAQVDAATRRTRQDEGEPEKREKQAHAKAAMYRYQRTLMAAIAKNNFCMHFIEKAWKKDPRSKREHLIDDEWVKARYVDCHFLLGRQVNVVATQIMYDYLVERMDDLLPYQGMDKRGKDALLWLEGCAERLVERLDGRRAEMEKESATAAQKEKARQSHPAYAGNGTALVVLSDVYGTEEDLNNDAARGWKPGETRRRRLEAEARQKVIEAKEQELIASGVDEDDAWYLARGYKVPAKNTPAVVEKKPETDAQRRKREAREERASNRYWEQWERRHEREAARKESHAYRSGRATGGEIGLDDQIGQGRKDRLR